VTSTPRTATTLPTAASVGCQSCDSTLVVVTVCANGFGAEAISVLMCKKNPKARIATSTTIPPIMMSIRFVMCSLQISFSVVVAFAGSSERLARAGFVVQRAAAGALAAEASAAGVFHQPPPSAWNSAAVSVKRAARACTSATRVLRYVRCASSAAR